MTIKSNQPNSHTRPNWITIELRTALLRWFKYDQDYLCVNKSQFVPVIFEPPCTYLLLLTANIVMIIIIIISLQIKRLLNFLFRSFKFSSFTYSRTEELQAESVREKGAEKVIWAYEGRGRREVRKNI
jgi:hypothetical protein